MERKPEWLKVRLPTGPAVRHLGERLRALRLHTVCEEARCPNRGECWGEGTATVMILGDTCTRGCRFCAVKTGNPRGWLDPFEPLHTAQIVKEMGLRYVVITSVDRDDLPDEGAEHFARTIRVVRHHNPHTMIEVLIPDFHARPECLQVIAQARPDVVAHNIETVRRLTPRVRDRRAGYDQSLQVLAYFRDHAPDLYRKSSIMVGLGETFDEVVETMRDLRDAGCQILTIGQYLRPTPRHLPVVRYVPPEEFEAWRQVGMEMGFLYVFAGPLVRSSYRAAEAFLQALKAPQTAAQPI
ncbi:Lipoyl synthase [bacterium HR11]|nr:Lipoyl synthase [bacterium HR11]